MQENSGIHWSLLISGALLIGCSSENSEESDWESVRNDPSSASIEEFLEHYPDGEFVEQVKLLEVEVRAWENTAAEDSEQAYRQFMADFPHSDLAQRARDKHDTMVADVLRSFEPDYLLIIDDFGLVDLVRDPSDGTIRVMPKVQWRGSLRYALGQQGAFTGEATYIAPDPSVENVAVAVMNDSTLIEPLRAGRVYMWRGGDFIYDWQDISSWGSRDEIAAKLGMPSATEYTTLPSELIAE